MNEENMREKVNRDDDPATKLTSSIIRAQLPTPAELQAFSIWRCHQIRSRLGREITTTLWWPWPFPFDEEMEEFDADGEAI